MPGSAVYTAVPGSAVKGYYTPKYRNSKVDSAAMLQNIVGLIPLALILGEITEDLAVRFGPTIGGLLNATFGNVVELILSIVALTKGLYTVVAASLVGSILSNLLLVLGRSVTTRGGIFTCGLASFNLLLSLAGGIISSALNLFLCLVGLLCRCCVAPSISVHTTTASVAVCLLLACLEEGKCVCCCG